MNQLRMANEYDYSSPETQEKMEILEIWCDQFKCIQSFEWGLLAKVPMWTEYNHMKRKYI